MLGLQKNLRFVKHAFQAMSFKTTLKYFLDFTHFDIYNVHMSSIHFEWDEAKAATNISKHGVSFEEARTVFYDEHARLISDPDHSDSEDRFILLGMSSALKILVVCHCYRSDDNIIRIISARKATTKEIKVY